MLSVKKIFHRQERRSISALTLTGSAERAADPGGICRRQKLFQQTNGINICLELGFRTAFTQMLIGNAEVFCIAEQVCLVFLIGGFLGSFGIGDGLPLAVDLNGNRAIRTIYLMMWWWNGCILRSRSRQPL